MKKNIFVRLAKKEASIVTTIITVLLLVVIGIFAYYVKDRFYPQYSDAAIRCLQAGSGRGAAGADVQLGVTAEWCGGGAGGGPGARRQIGRYTR